jgi:hypothetical protein
VAHSLELLVPMVTKTSLNAVGLKEVKLPVETSWKKVFILFLH